MDWKRKYEVQMKINEDMKKEMDNLRLAISSITDERDTLLGKVDELKMRNAVVETYQQELVEQIQKAKDLQKKCSESLKESKQIEKKYRSRLAKFLFGTKLQFRRIK